MSSIDDLIRERLQKLRTSDQENTTVNIPSTSTKTNPLPNKITTSAAEQVENLLAQLSEETNLEVKFKKSEGDFDAQIRSRLEKLKSREGCNFTHKTLSSVTPASKSNDDIHDEDFFKQSSCSELLNLETDHNDTDTDKSCDSELSDSESDIVCTICDKKPSLICFGCDKDLYCTLCFKQFHSSDEKHKTVPYFNKST